ncbi:glycosyltransferase 36 associated family protein [Yersinia rochesterensis]|uniref:Glycosyltransferase 36 associated family protein n=1 Tax=Yersinia rochesterensis TaxID=1604335 RepID=A0ABM5SPA7_9GAMM|nr:glucoamylase family protein [Yersinia rochesterensis]AJI88311.1 glycosyltransferase 36 associated family protein [Yersinia frederiksenii Y225]AJJ36370.1 glycosyltransferase 36 associated family protein [Yersinia rochesterensis]CRY63524.1 cyclic beta-1%2C2-glucan synthase [Yersinia kristensenii]
MKLFLKTILGQRPMWGSRTTVTPWHDFAPVREELFSVERLEQHAESLAKAQSITTHPPRVSTLHARLDDNANTLLAAYRASAAELEKGRTVVPAAEWLLDNYHLVEEQIREIRDDLPPGYYRQLPKLADGPFAGYPRVLGITWAFVAHTDSHLDPDALCRFIMAYQRVQPLTIGELWAVAITLRIVLIENLRRLADQITQGRKARADAEVLANKLLKTGDSRLALESDIAMRSTEPLSEQFASQLAKRLRDQDPRTTPALGWLEDRLKLQGVTVSEVVQNAQLRQGASNVSVRNVITSMRLISDIDWADLFESVSLVDECLRQGSAFASMDFQTRNLYRSAIEQLCRGSTFTELEIARLALQAAQNAAATAEPENVDRCRDPGYHLISAGRRELEEQVRFSSSIRLWFSRLSIRLGVGGYMGAILLVTAGLLALALWALSFPGLATGWLVLLAFVGFIPATEVATVLINRVITWSFGATILPGLELTNGVPDELRTLVVVPTLLTSKADLLEQIDQLEVHHLSGTTSSLTFALLLDGADADTQVVASDGPLLALADEAIARLNQQYGPGPAGPRFLLLYRQRIFNESENRWMGWERKRGKLHELNRLLRGATDTSFIATAAGEPQVPADVRYVITLDADTRLPRDAALRLIGKMAHPLNRPRFSADQQRVVDGYGILQPRVTLALPMGKGSSLYQWVFSGPGGMDPYAAAVSDVYQDIFGEGSYTGKGIYDVDAFEASLLGRVPDNTLLSHDLFEGIFARAGLASDIEVVEESPARYDVVSKRQHRWTRGDWQLLPWIIKSSIIKSANTTPANTKHSPDSKSVPLLGRWKMVDNLRRSLVAPFTLLLLGISWMLPMPAAWVGVLLVIVLTALPAFLPILCSLWPAPNTRLSNHFRSLFDDTKRAASQTFLSLVFLADHAWQMADAIGRTLIRLFITHRNLLEWMTAAQSAGQPRPGLSGFYRHMAGGALFGMVMSVIAFISSPNAWPLILPFAVLWLFAPAIALWASRTYQVVQHNPITADDILELRLTARRTWRFFETFVTPDENMLPPDNFQEDPKPVVAHRTSPTNMGLYLLSTLVARDFGWAGTYRTLVRLETTFDTFHKLALFRGHFFNWYDTQDLRVLEPAYVSSVDSGNLAGHLIVLANTCEEWAAEPLAANGAKGLMDNLLLAKAAFRELPPGDDDFKRKLWAILAQIRMDLKHVGEAEMLPLTLKPLLAKASAMVHGVARPIDDNAFIDLSYWIETLIVAAAEHEYDQRLTQEMQEQVADRLLKLAAEARHMALAMDFAFLLDPERKLLSIGYSLVDNSLDPSCYDLLASEARLASLFAIAKGDVPTRHWFRLGRAATPIGKGAALISWSGSMFEYLMPSLVMRAPAGSLLDQTNQLVVERQQAYGRSLNIPWGISESAYNARDIEFTYQYSNFGVPGLGLKRGLSENTVIAPYATGLATMIDPHGALQNYERLAKMGALGRYGFYEALDFTRSRLPENQPVAIVRNYMAHHQGMTIVAIANTVQQGRMRNRFHREPMIQACELLLQERMPRNVAIAYPRTEEVLLSAVADNALPTMRRFHSSVIGAPVIGPPITHLLSNGRYAVMLTTAGAGYSRWLDVAVTRWREDATCDDYGSFIFLRDLRSGRSWSAGAQLAASDNAHREVIFGEDHAEFICRDGTLTSTMNVLISSEDDGEVRRVSLLNTGRRAREIELTSYAEMVLTAAAADNAHPAFAKMFVVTEFLPELGALIATRRPRTAQEPQVWAAHFMVADGLPVSVLQYETDRAKFIGRGNRVATSTAIQVGESLSNTLGTVLDPIFSLRQSLLVPAGKTVTVSFWTLIASSKEALLDSVDRHRDRSAYDRAKTLAWTQAQVQLRHLDIKAEEAADFQQLAAPILYADARFRSPSTTIMRGAGAQSMLWAQSISGDLPIVLLRIEDIEDIEQVRQLLRAHEYWRMKRLAVDLVIINERASSYVQDLQIAIETAVRSSQSRPRFGDELRQGSAYALRADLMSAETRALLYSVARVVLSARYGTLGNQLNHLLFALDKKVLPSNKKRFASDKKLFVSDKKTSLSDNRLIEKDKKTGFSLIKSANSPANSPLPLAKTLLPQPDNLEFFNGLGGFGQQGREYVTYLNDGENTPAPWINVISNQTFGFQVSATGSGYTWAENSRENQITPWLNDPVIDSSGECLYLRDEDSGLVWSPTAQPIRDGGTYIARHGHGYSRFEHQANGIGMALLQYVPLADPIKISRLTLHNMSDKPRRISVTAYAEWVLATSRGASGPFIITEMDESTGAMLARNPWSTAFPGRVSFADLNGQQNSWTADRSEFLGHYGNSAAPLSLLAKIPLSGATGAGFDPCSALQQTLELAAGEQVEVVWFIGQCDSVSDTQTLITRYRAANLDAVLTEVTDYWRTVLEAVQVKTPDRQMDIMLNGWLLYQTLACRVWARSAFYQASGAYGFRDQLQDGMALTFALPETTRHHLLRAAGRQFIEGDVQHWWLPHSGQGVRTRISDDRVWLSYATATYILASGDAAVLDEIVPFLEGPILHPGEHDAFFQPLVAQETASLFEHCAKGLDQCIELTGELGLPLMGTGDWNDGMNRVGEEGKGESVWLGWLLVATLKMFIPLAQERDPLRASQWQHHLTGLIAALEREAWDGDWYRRATFDNGSWLGSKECEECRIDSIAQSWAVLSGAADPQRAVQAMASLEQHLIRPDDGMALLFTPPFDKTPDDPGYIKGYPPGLRENGGQYSHAAMWVILAFAELGKGDKARDLFALLNPINHGDTPERIARYKVEPYVVAADVYSVAPHVGRGGWTWYTGSAGWMHRAGIEGILGIRREGQELVINPCIPASWPGFEATINLANTRYAIRVESPAQRCQGISSATLNGSPISYQLDGLRVALDGGEYELIIVL